MLAPELAELTRWLQAAARNGYGYSGDNGKVWVLPDIFAGVFGFAVDPDNTDTLNLYCQKSELNWLNPADQCMITPVKDAGCELNFWFLDKVAFVLPVPVAAKFAKVALYVYPDLLTEPIKIFSLGPSCVDHRCRWPAITPRFHFAP